MTNDKIVISESLYDAAEREGWHTEPYIKARRIPIVGADYGAIEARAMAHYLGGVTITDEAHYMKPREQWKKALDFAGAYGLIETATRNFEMPRKIAKLPALAMPYGRKLNPQAGKRRILGRLAYALVNSASPLALGSVLPRVKPPFAG